VHERNQATDLLLGILLQAYKQEEVPPDLQVPLDSLPHLVIMSATLQAGLFEQVNPFSLYALEMSHPELAC
jgi:HrpA-like RNA helicase